MKALSDYWVPFALLAITWIAWDVLPFWALLVATCIGIGLMGRAVLRTWKSLLHKAETS